MFKIPSETIKKDFFNKYLFCFPRLTTVDYLLVLQLAAHFLLYWGMVVWGSPEREWSLGLHEPVGPCDQVATLVTPFGQVGSLLQLQLKKKF